MHQNWIKPAAADCCTSENNRIWWHCISEVNKWVAGVLSEPEQHPSMAPLTQTFFFCLFRVRKQRPLGHRVLIMCRMCFGTERCWWLLDKTKQCDACSEAHHTHRPSLLTGRLVVNLWPGQIMKSFVAEQGENSHLTSHTFQSSHWRRSIMLLLIMLVYSFEAFSHSTNHWHGQRRCECVSGCAKAPDVLGTCRVEGPAVCRTVELVWLDTDAQGHTGRPLCKRTDTHT